MFNKQTLQTVDFSYLFRMLKSYAVIISLMGIGNILEFRDPYNEFLLKKIGQLCTSGEGLIVYLSQGHCW